MCSKRLTGMREALAICDEVLALDPDSALAHYNRGNVLLDLNRYEEALARLRPGAGAHARQCAGALQPRLRAAAFRTA